MWTTIGGIVSIIAVFVANYFSWKERERKGKTPYEHDADAFDQALSGGDTGALSDMFERLRPPPTEGGDGDPGGPDDTKTAKREL